MHGASDGPPMWLPPSERRTVSRILKQNSQPSLAPPLRVQALICDDGGRDSRQTPARQALCAAVADEISAQGIEEQNVLEAEGDALSLALRERLRRLAAYQAEHIAKNDGGSVKKLGARSAVGEPGMCCARAEREEAGPKTVGRSP